MIKMEKQAMKQKWKAGNMIYPLPAVMISCGDQEKFLLDHLDFLMDLLKKVVILLSI
ncbi:MAG: hypothetical protein K0S30_411 [Clostridia bacterium]|nr:hypothetical protein [Clostridia bacterium]